MHDALERAPSKEEFQEGSNIQTNIVIVEIAGITSNYTNMYGQY
jgi:hypothetical protein